MAEVKTVEEKYKPVERVVTEDVLVRPSGYEVFLTHEEATGLRTLLGLGIDSTALQALGLEGLWNALDEAGLKPNMNTVFSQHAKVMR